MNNLTRLEAAIDKQLAGDGSSLRDMSRELLSKNQQLEDLVTKMLPHVSHTLQRGRFRESLKRITG